MSLSYAELSVRLNQFITERDREWCGVPIGRGDLAMTIPTIPARHGGGVVVREVCAVCGCYRETDSWAQRPDTGEQGLKSIAYEEADDASLAWIEGR